MYSIKRYMNKSVEIKRRGITTVDGLLQEYHWTKEKAGWLDDGIDPAEEG